MSQAWKTSRSLKSRASSASWLRSGEAATRQSGSTLTIREPGQAAQSASMPAIAARQSATFSSHPQPSRWGANQPFSAAAKAMKLGSFTGVNRQGASLRMPI